MKRIPIYFSLAIFLVLFFIFPKHAFWVRDCGNKFLLMQCFEWNGNPIGSLPDPGKNIDPKHEFYAIPEPFSYERYGEMVSQYPPYFSILCKPWFEMFSFSGLLALPFVFGIATSLLTLWIGKRICLFRHAPLLSVVLFFATPLLFYHFIFWEHTLSVFLCLAATAFVLCSEKRSLFLMAGVVLGGGLFFREESLLYFLSLLAACLMDQNRRAKIGWLLTGFGVMTAVWLSIQNLFGIEPLQHFYQQLQFSLKNLKTINVLINLVFGSGKSFWMLSLGFLLFLGILTRFFRNSRLQEGVQGMGVLCILIYAGWLWKSPEKSVEHLLYFNGMLLVFPIILILFLKKEETKSGEKYGLDHEEIFLIRVSVGFCALVGLTCPWITSFGVHWGPRVLLPVFPLLALLILKRFGHFLSPPIKSLRLALLGGWLLGTLLLQGHALSFLFEKLNLNQKIEKLLTQAPEKHIVTSIPWLAEEMAPLFLEKSIFYCQDQKNFLQLIELLKKKNIREFLWVHSATIQESTDQENKELQLPKNVPYFLIKVNHCGV